MSNTKIRLHNEVDVRDGTAFRVKFVLFDSIKIRKKNNRLKVIRIKFIFTFLVGYSNCMYRTIGVEN